MAQDAVDDPRVCNEGDNPHAGATGAEERVNLENLLQQARPGASGFLGEVGILLLGVGVCRGSGAIAGVGWSGDSGTVAVVP
jgi:hypothetical protein